MEILLCGEKKSTLNMNWVTMDGPEVANWSAWKDGVSQYVDFPYHLVVRNCLKIWMVGYLNH